MRRKRRDASECQYMKPLRHFTLLLHDMAFTSVTPLSPHLCSWLGPSPRARTSSDVARVRCVTRQRKVMLVLVLVLCWCWCWY